MLSGFVDVMKTNTIYLSG